jgi:hypothetical protein
VHYAQAGIPAQDEHHGGQDEQHRQGYGQEITSFLFRRQGQCGRAHVRLSRKPRRDLRRDQRPRATHFTQASAPSFASAPHAHARPWRQPGNTEHGITRSPSFHQCRSSLLSGMQRCAARQSRLPSAPGILDSCRAARFPFHWGLGGPALLCVTCRAPLAFHIYRGASLISTNCADGLSRRFALLSRRADRLWPPFLRNFPGGTGPRRNLTEPARAGARGRVSNGTKRASESVVTVRLIPVGVARVAQ